MNYQHNRPQQPARRSGAATASARPHAERPAPTPEPRDPRAMSLGELAQRCAAESERFYRGRDHDTRFAYELFRRALVERDEAAWELIYRQYSPLVERWASRSGAFASSGESGEFFVAAAFTRFWRAIDRERFATFPTLAALLHYLRLCAGCVVIDSVRSQSWAEMLPEEALTPSRAPQAAADEQALERVSRAEFWRYISALLHSEGERAVVLGTYVLGMTPADIYARHPALFSSVSEVYNVKRNVLGRLGRNRELRQMFADQSA